VWSETCIFFEVFPVFIHTVFHAPVPIHVFSLSYSGTLSLGFSILWQPFVINLCHNILLSPPSQFVLEILFFQAARLHIYLAGSWVRGAGNEIS
jgi:hypothetical protein